MKAVDKVFSVYDNDKNTTLEPNEVRKLLADGYKKIRTRRQVNDDDIRRFMETCDKNRNGRVTKSELIHALKHIAETP